jgi:hypothetical protein
VALAFGHVTTMHADADDAPLHAAGPSRTLCDDATMINEAWRSAPDIAFCGRAVSGCVDCETRPVDLPFALAWTRSLRALASHERSGALAGVTGHVAESVVELLLAELGYHPVHDFIGPGRHGVDLLMLSPAADHVLAIEVRGRCVPDASHACRAAPWRR